MTKYGDAKRNAAAAKAKAEEARIKAATVGVFDVLTHGHSGAFKAAKWVAAENRLIDANNRVEAIKKTRKQHRDGAINTLAWLGERADGGGRKRHWWE